MLYWRTVALIGTVTFLFSGFLPLISTVLYSYSLIDFYGLETGIKEPPFGTWTMPSGLAGVFLTMFLYPVTLILGFLAVFRRSLALPAGAVGIVCWLSAFFAVNYFKATYEPSQFSYMIQFGSGIFLGFVGAIIILISFFLSLFLKTQGLEYVRVRPQLPDRYCTFCGAELSEGDIYCRKCGKAVPS